MRDASLRLGIAAVNEPKTLWRSVARCNRALRTLLWVDSVEEVRKQIGVHRTVRRRASSIARLGGSHAGFGLGIGISFASLRRFWAVAARRNSSRAPLGPRKRSRSSLSRAPAQANPGAWPGTDRNVPSRVRSCGARVLLPCKRQPPIERPRTMKLSAPPSSARPSSRIVTDVTGVEVTDHWTDAGRKLFLAEVKVTTDHLRDFPR
jgi:hypothetical protein